MSDLISIHALRAEGDRCGECKHADNWNEKYANCHTNEGILVEREDFCSSFEPKGGECDG